MYTFATLDTYKITHEKKNEKFTIDYKVLLRLYAPIIGATAVSLYLLLESEASLNKHSKTNKVFLDYINYFKLMIVNSIMQ